MSEPKSVRFQHRIATGHSILGSPFVAEIENPLNDPLNAPTAATTTTARTAKTSESVKKTFRQFRQHLPVPTVLVVDDALVLSTQPLPATLPSGEIQPGQASIIAIARSGGVVTATLSSVANFILGAEVEVTDVLEPEPGSSPNTSIDPSIDRTYYAGDRRYVTPDGGAAPLGSAPPSSYDEDPGFDGTFIVANVNVASSQLQWKQAGPNSSGSGGEITQAEQPAPRPRVTLLYKNGNPMSGADWHNAVSVETDVPHVNAEGAEASERFWFEAGEYEPTAAESQADPTLPTPSNPVVVTTRQYSDGSSATGVAPLPALSPAQQDATRPAVRTTASMQAAADQDAAKQDAMLNARSAPASLPVSVPMTAVGDVQIPAFVAPAPAAEPDITKQLDSEPSAPETATE
jgi:hypothetical protein